MFLILRAWILALCLLMLAVNGDARLSTGESVPILSTYGGLGFPVLVIEHDGSPIISVVKPGEVVCCQDVWSNAVMCGDDVTEEGLVMGLEEDVVVRVSPGRGNYTVCRHRRRPHTAPERLEVCESMALDPASSIQQRLSSITAWTWNRPRSSDLHTSQTGSKRNHDIDQTGSTYINQTGSKRNHDIDQTGSSRYPDHKQTGSRDSYTHIRRFLWTATEVGTGTVNATVEILVWTDFSFYESFRVSSVAGSDVEKEIRRYIVTTVSAANLRFQTALADDPSFIITLVVSGLVICKTRNCSQFIDDYSVNNSVNNYVALDHFTDALRRSYVAHTLQFRYDFAALFTRLDLTDAQGVPIGVANADDICKVQEGKSSAVIEDQGGYSSVGTFVHELSHTLGADHDGWYRGVNCTSADGYIMSSLTPLSRNGFHFSPCSIKSMKENLLKPTAACVYDTPHPLMVGADLTSTLPGQMYNTTSQCRQLYGTAFCQSMGTRLEDICYKMYCWDPALANVCSTKSPAALGTSCGQGKSEYDQLLVCYSRGGSGGGNMCFFNIAKCHHQMLTSYPGACNAFAINNNP